MSFQQTYTAIEQPSLSAVGQAARDQVRRLGTMFFGLIGRQRQRNALADLDARLLADIGVTPDAARAEAAKPFWES